MLWNTRISRPSWDTRCGKNFEWLNAHDFRASVLKISMIVSISFDTEAMPRLNPQQEEQAICRLHSGQPARVIANDFNCSVRTIERLRVRYNATNSSRPQIATPRQNRLMVRQHLRNRFTRATETARQTGGTHQRPISAE